MEILESQCNEARAGNINILSDGHERGMCTKNILGTGMRQAGAALSLSYVTWIYLFIYLFIYFIWSNIGQGFGAG
jgi:hypothetical protein